jgi:hypothetical protein
MPVRRITADRAHVDEPGAFGIRPEPAAAILRRRGGQTRRAARRGRMWRVAEIVGAGMEPPIVALSANGSIRPLWIEPNYG